MLESCACAYFIVLSCSVEVLRPSEVQVSCRVPASSVLWMSSWARPLKAGMVNCRQSIALGWSMPG